MPKIKYEVTDVGLKCLTKCPKDSFYHVGSHACTRYCEHFIRNNTKHRILTCSYNEPVKEPKTKQAKLRVILKPYINTNVKLKEVCATITKLFQKEK